MECTVRSRLKIFNLNFLNKLGIYKNIIVNLQHDIRFTQFMELPAAEEVVDEADSVDSTLSER